MLGIDASEDALEAARAHLEVSGLDVEYRAATAEALAESLPGRFDLVTCMELVEHVPDGAALVAACARLARPGGTVVFSTINRTPKAYALAIVAAEYVLRMLPQRDTRLRPSRPAVGTRAVGQVREPAAGRRDRCLLVPRSHGASGWGATPRSTTSRRSRRPRTDRAGSAARIG